MIASRPHTAAPPRRHATIGNVPPPPRVSNVGRCGPSTMSSMPPVPNVILAWPGRDATLADERRLLVAGDAGDRRRTVERRRLADRAGRVDDGRQDRAGDVQQRRARDRPSRRRCRVSEPGDRGVGEVGDVHLASGEVPHDPRVDRAEAQVAAAGRVGSVEQVLHLGGRLVRREAQSLGLQHEAVADGAEVLPAEGGRDRHAGRAVPHDRRGALVGDADGVDGAALGEGRSGHVERGLGQDRRVELDETRRGGVGAAPRDGARAVTVASGVTIAAAHPARADVDDEDAHGLSPPRGLWDVRGAFVSHQFASTPPSVPSEAKSSAV